MAEYRRHPHDRCMAQALHAEQPDFCAGKKGNSEYKVWRLCMCIMKRCCCRVGVLTANSREKCTHTSVTHCAGHQFMCAKFAKVWCNHAHFGKPHPILPAHSQKLARCHRKFFPRIFYRVWLSWNRKSCDMINWQEVMWYYDCKVKFIFHSSLVELYRPVKLKEVLAVLWRASQLR
jgi:hypothetical protein